jgi:coenzyme F420-reducing hydrogenase alpha subunit
MHNLDLSIADIAKIEGKATCDIKVRDGKVQDVKFGIAEYKRFYTQAIRNKDILALPQLTARICGTCSNAHLLCALNAVEDAINLIPSEQTVLLRKLLHFGLIIRDHALHLYIFVLPDLFGRDSILDFDENNPLEHKFLEAAFSVKAVGNNLSKRVGGRSVHAPFLTVGGFTRIPDENELKKSITELKGIRENVLELIDIFAKRDLCLIKEDLNFAALIDDKYSFLDGDILVSDGKKIPKKEYAKYLWHVVTPYSHASRYTFSGKLYMVGALARLNLGKENLNPRTLNDTRKYINLFLSKNIFHNNLAQGIEILHAIDSSIDILNDLKVVNEKPIFPVRREGIGIGIIEAPRGTLYYKLDVDQTGKVKDGQIVVPTGQNQICIERTITRFLEKNIKVIKNRETVELEVEKIVRAYDPCMSCASHFLKFKWS